MYADLVKTIKYPHKDISSQSKKKMVPKKINEPTVYTIQDTTPEVPEKYIFITESSQTMETISG